METPPCEIGPGRAEEVRVSRWILRAPGGLDSPRERRGLTSTGRGDPSEKREASEIYRRENQLQNEGKVELRFREILLGVVQA